MADSVLPDVPAVAHTVRALGAALIDRCGLGVHDVETVVDPHPIDLEAAIADAAARTEGVFLFYYVGHGLVDDRNQLHLATHDTDHYQDRLEFKALAYSAVGRALRRSPARAIIVVLDCCFAGRAYDVFGPAAKDAFDLAESGGMYVLAAASSSEVAQAPAGKPHTAFSGELITLLRHGAATEPPNLTVEGAYRQLRRALPLGGSPAPVRHLRGQAGEVVLASNLAHAPAPVAAAPERVPAADERCPYRGLDPFTADDAAFYFGRARLVDELLGRLAEWSADGKPIAVLGRSGVGKSSLLRAGLMPAVVDGEMRVPDSHTWPQLVITPGERPLDTLAARLTTLIDATTDQVRDQLAADPDSLATILRELLPTGRLLLIVDQLEELFTLCRDVAQRRRFIQAICAAAHERTALVVLGIRADFYGSCLAYPQLAEALARRQVTVGPMTEDEMREAIEKPAAQTGLGLEPSLSSRVLRDLGAGRDFAVGALPLLSYALLLTWQRRRGTTLTVLGYEATGGVLHAVTQAADDVYRRLDETGRRAMRVMLLRMVNLNEDTEDTRRRVDLDALTREFPAVARAREALATARLITVDGDTAQISHEALLHAWPTLRSWIDTDRAGLLVQQKLTDAALEWNRSGADPNLHYRGSRLRLATDWAAAHPGRVSKLERHFLDASVRAERRRSRVRRGVTVTLVLLLVGALTGMTFALYQRGVAQERQRTSVARGLVNRADAARDSAPRLALMLGVAADQLDSSVSTNAGLVTSLLQPYAGTISGSGAPTSIAYSNDGRLLATGWSGHEVTVWNGTRKVAAFSGTDIPSALAFDPHGHRLVVGGTDGAVSLWDLTDPARPTLLSARPGHTGKIGTIEFSPDGRLLVTSSPNQPAILWDVTDPTNPRQGGRITTESNQLRSAAFSPDSRRLLTGDRRGEITLWDITDPGTPVGLTDLTGHASNIADAVDFSPDGRRAAVTNGNLVQVWDLGDPRQPARLARLADLPTTVAAVRFDSTGNALEIATLESAWIRSDITDPAKPTRATVAPGGRSPISMVTIADDGNQMASAGVDGTVILNRTMARAVPRMPPALGHCGDAVRSTRYSTDGTMLAVGCLDGTVNLWAIADRTRPVLLGSLAGSAGPTGAVAFSADGRVLAAGRYDGGNVDLWDLSDRSDPRLLATRNAQIGDVSSLVFAPEGRILAVAGEQGALLWDVEDPRAPRPSTRLDTNITVQEVAFSKDGRTVASGRNDNSATLWDITDPSRGIRRGTMRHAGAVSSLAFRPDGRTLVTGSLDDSVVVWDIGDRDHPRMASTPLVEHTDWVLSVSFSPDGRLMATTGRDGRLVMWETSDVTHPRRLVAEHSDRSTFTATFSPDGHTLATGGFDDLVHLSDLAGVLDARAHARELACERAGRGLNETEWHEQIPDLPYRQTCP
ncbi:caspase family protein [Nocardia sp. NBC_00508]|uniref:caspase, EACC1-associated type n=1 Tax=Nocardia sp. NBC_00508 TaxID=2975992 RepID=UPI002E8155E2|nr:caspase family protein [Nocardia sp. NBC_00508]WUD65029.1 caspase family protein [Nocardia sp. NBC_00508]